MNRDQEAYDRWLTTEPEPIETIEEVEATCNPDCDERDQCDKAGQFGHLMCGHCDYHNEPRHHCGCIEGL